MTTFSPLTVSGEPYFYYIRFPDKKGVSSVMGGETNVVSVLRVFYPPSTREPIGYLSSNVVDIICPFIVKTTHVVKCGIISNNI
jgi:hypothetical protein